MIQNEGNPKTIERSHGRYIANQTEAKVPRRERERC